MAKYERAKINGMNWREYAYDLVVNQGKGKDDWEDYHNAWWSEGMREATAKWVMRDMATNSMGYRDETFKMVERKRLSETVWHKHPVTPRQIRFMVELGVEMSEEEMKKLTKGQASQIITMELEN